MKKLALFVFVLASVFCFFQATITPLHAQQLLYDNGPFITPGSGFGGAAVSAVQTALGMSVYGFGDQLSQGYRLTDDFTVTSPTGWQIDQIIFYTYQNNSPIDTSTITEVNYAIWDGPATDLASRIVYGDTTTNRLVSSVWSNIYRVPEANLLDTTRPIMANTVSANVGLPPGRYWLDWQTGGTLTSGPWVPPITILGETTTGDALQYVAAWGPITDGGTAAPQGLPFVIQGTPFLGTIGTQVTMTDSGFGTKKGKVYIGGFKQKVESWSDTSVTIIVNKFTGLATDTPLDVSIQPKEPKGTAPINLPGAFTLKKPEIDPISTATGSPEEEITINGMWFGTKKGTVYVGDQKCKVTSWTMNPATGVSTLTFVVHKKIGAGTYGLEVENKIGRSVSFGFKIN
jgi:hypothetical protein